MSSKKINGSYRFLDYPTFRPNLSPREIFKNGSFGGTYWRPIYSTIVKKNLKNQHLKYPKNWWKGIPTNYLINTWNNYDISINKYKKKVGTTLEYWEDNKWITRYHPYGWVEWYCDFFQGKRGPDDIRQIARWEKLAGPNGRFRKRLINLIIKNKSDYNDYTISPSIRQTLQHWGYKLTKIDYNKALK
tara:strand:+ start:44 stop:607 length:564 start_codon:yes stop_codon:yes gene_type:complete